MSRDYWHLFAVFFISLLAGLLTDQLLLSLFIGLALFISWYGKRLSRLLKWLNRKTDTPPVETGGAIEEIIREFDYLRRHYKQRGEKLSGYLKQFQQATNALPDAVILLGENGKIEGANNKASVYLNVHWPQDSGQRISNLIRHPELINYLRDLDHELPQYNLELVMPHSQQRRLEFRVVPFGEIQRLLIARDITRIYRAKEMRKDFIANASHELRSPLTVISGYLESFEDDSEECPEAWLPIVKQMRNQTARMQRLIEDLLQLSALESADKQYQREEIRVAELLSSIYKEAGIISGLMDHIFYLEIDAELCLMGNQKELYSAFSNLVFNAVQYTPAHGVIRIRWYEDEEGAHMQVSDSGEGIPAEHIGRLTERFYRVDKGRSREKGGTGLGLAIVKHVLVRHKAKLHIESSYGQGSTFRCDFPKELISRKLGDVSQIA